MDRAFMGKSSPETSSIFPGSWGPLRFQCSLFTNPLITIDFPTSCLSYPQKFSSMVGIVLFDRPWPRYQMMLHCPGTPSGGRVEDWDILGLIPTFIGHPNTHENQCRTLFLVRAWRSSAYFSGRGKINIFRCFFNFWTVVSWKLW